MEIHLDLETERYVNEPSYRNGPFLAENHPPQTAGETN